MEAAWTVLENNVKNMQVRPYESVVSYNPKYVPQSQLPHRTRMPTELEGAKRCAAAQKSTHVNRD